MGMQASAMMKLHSCKVQLCREWIVVCSLAVII